MQEMQSAAGRVLVPADRGDAVWRAAVNERSLSCAINVRIKVPHDTDGERVLSRCLFTDMPGKRRSIRLKNYDYAQVRIR